MLARGTKQLLLRGSSSSSGLLRFPRSLSLKPVALDKACCGDHSHDHKHHNHTAEKGAVSDHNKAALPLNEAAREQKRGLLSLQYREIIKTLGEDVTREGLVRTPDRAAKAMLEFTHGYTLDPKQILRQALFHEETDDQMVMLRDIEFFSLCEHHLVPFIGKATILYQPSGKIIGLSKLARITDVYARRLQVQERMTKEIAECLQEVLEPKGVAVKLEATHFCMAMRGVRKSGVTTTTTFMTGVFKTNTESRKEAMSHLNQTNV